MKSQLRNTMLPLAGRLSTRPQPPADDTILIIQPDHLGDILLAQPAVRWLRLTNPTSRLIAAVGPWSRDIASIAWPVDEVQTLPYPGFTRAHGTGRLAPYQQLIDSARTLAPLRPKAAFVLRPDAWWAAWLGSLIAPEVITSDDPRCAAFATAIVPLDDEHATVRALRIASNGQSGTDVHPSTHPLTLAPSHEHQELASKTLASVAVSEPYVVIHPGSGAAVKEWPAHRWATVATTLASEGFTIVLTGSQGESAMCDEIAEQTPNAISLAGQTPIPVLAEILRAATVVLGPDCGPLHLAVAVGTPTVHLFGPSDPNRYGPWGHPARHHVVRASWSCPRCGDLSPARHAGCGCMLAISADDVIATARSVMSAYAR